MIEFDKEKYIYFVGIGGASMHSLALALNNAGYKVIGSDNGNSEYLEKLMSTQIKVYPYHSTLHMKNVGLLVYSGAIKENNVERRYAKRNNIPCIDRAELLGMLCNEFKTVIAVAGTHGKSTTANMIYQILLASNFKVSCHIGANVENARFDLNDDYLVVEACEYNKSFLHLNYNVAVLTNVEKDHLECYGGFSNLKNAFITFLKKAEKRYVLLNKSTSFISLGNVEKIKQSRVLKDTKKFVFDKNIFKFQNISGIHNVWDSQLAIKVCKDLGVDYKVIYNTLKTYKALDRRLQYLGEYGGQFVYTDYAHHPTEIGCSLDCFDLKNTIVIFQPHTYSRTKYLFKDFVKVFTKVDNLVLYKEYSAREKKQDGVSSFALYTTLKRYNLNSRYFGNFRSLKKHLKHFNNYNILFLGAGDIGGIAKKYCGK